MDRGTAPNPKTQRLFLALWPDDAVQQQQQQQQQQQLRAHASQWTWPPGCVPYLPADWHLTLHFIGSVAADRVPHIVAHVGVPFQSFELVLDQPRLWPRGLAVLGATALPPSLQALLERLRHALRGLELPVESRPFQAHVTLARRADAAVPPEAAAPVVWRVRGYALVVSTGDREQRYRVIGQYR